MFIKLLKSKLHRARVTATKLHYSGSIAVDSELMDAAGLVPYEAVLIANVSNGNRFETYVVPAEAGSKEIVIMGAAANLAQPADIIIIIGFGFFTSDEAGEFKPKVVVLDENNDIVKPMS